MEFCCDKKTSNEEQNVCVECSKPTTPVKAITLRHQLRFPYNTEIEDDQTYYFCANPDCETVYFVDKDRRFRVDTLRQSVGQKSREDSRFVCYCFDIRAKDIASEEARESAKQYVTKMTRTKQCACQIRNPSGKCCLSDF